VNEPKLSNVELITGLMTHPRYGAAMQVFIIDALMKQSERVIRTPKERLHNHIIDPQLWKDTAIELHNALMTHLDK
jgi:hypothetical protein